MEQKIEEIGGELADTMDLTNPEKDEEPPNKYPRLPIGTIVSVSQQLFTLISDYQQRIEHNQRVNESVLRVAGIGFATAIALISYLFSHQEKPFPVQGFFLIPLARLSPF